MDTYAYQLPVEVPDLGVIRRMTDDEFAALPLATLEAIAITVDHQAWALERDTCTLEEACRVRAAFLNYVRARGDGETEAPLMEEHRIDRSNLALGRRMALESEALQERLSAEIAARRRQDGHHADTDDDTEPW